jgi:hypothetical protein
MLGEKFGELSGKITSQRVLDIAFGAKMETTVNATGKISNIDVSSIITYWNIRKPDGYLYGEGQGILMTDGEVVASSKSQGIGKVSETGNARWVGSIFYYTSSNKKLIYLNNLVGLFETEVDTNGQVREMIWEWK